MLATAAEVHLLSLIRSGHTNGEIGLWAPSTATGGKALKGFCRGKIWGQKLSRRFLWAEKNTLFRSRGLGGKRDKAKEFRDKTSICLPCQVT